MAKVTVVVIRSLSYTGTTWLNTVMGCHARALALGPADRIWNIAHGKAAGPACLTHGEQCDFWPGFLAQYSPDKNLFLDLARYSAKSVLVTNNLVPDGAGTQLHHPDILIKLIQVVRDARVLAASFHRKFPDKSFLQAITDFVQPSLHYFEFNEQRADPMCLRYESVIADQENTLARIGKFIGLDYEPRALRFWEWRQHLTHGNPGTIALTRLGEGLPLDAFEGREFYRQEFARLKSGATFRDDRADATLSRRDRFIFDCLAGADNERLGYARDRFSREEIEEFTPLIHEAVRSGALPLRFTQHVPVDIPGP